MFKTVAILASLVGGKWISIISIIVICISIDVYCVMYHVWIHACSMYIYSQYFLYLLIGMHSNRMIDDAGLYES